MSGTAHAIPPSPWRRPEFVRLLSISVTVALGFGLVVPVLSRYAQSFGVALAVVGLVQTVFGLTRFAFGLVGGLVVDRFGTRACTIAGLLIVALSSYAAGFAQNFPQLVMARGFGGAGSAMFIAGLMNRIISIIEPEAMGRAMGAFRASFLVGIGAGPAIGGIVSRYFGLAAPFHFYATSLVVAAVVAWFAMRQDTPFVRSEERKSPLDALRAAGRLLGDLRYIAALLATFAGWWTISGPAQIIGPIFAEKRLDFSDTQIGFATTMLAVGEAGILLLAGRAADRYGRRAVLVPSLIAIAAATSLAGQIEAFSWAFYPILIVIGAGISAAAIAAGGLLADSVPEGGSGTAVGVNQMTGDLGYLTAPLALGWVAQMFGFPLAYIAGAVPALLVLIVAVRLPRRTIAAEPEAPLAPAGPVG